MHVVNTRPLAKIEGKMESIKRVFQTQVLKVELLLFNILHTEKKTQKVSEDEYQFTEKKKLMQHGIEYRCTWTL